MTSGSAAGQWQRSIVLLSGTVVTVVAVTVLYWAQSIFIPVALAIFLTFLLNPVVSRLRLWGVRRTPAVILTVFTAGLLLGFTGWIVTAQISSLLRELPEHTETVKAKVKSLKSLVGGSSRFADMIEEINSEIRGTPAKLGSRRRSAGIAEARARSRPRAVIVEPQSPVWLGRITSFLSPMMEYLGELALAIILVDLHAPAARGIPQPGDQARGLRPHCRLPPSSSTRRANESAVSCSCKRSSTARSG